MTFMGRPPINIALSVNLTLLDDIPDRMKAVQRPGETRLDFIRTAVTNEVNRRETFQRREAEDNRTV
jgi:hypothetical protein